MKQGSDTLWTEEDIQYMRDHSQEGLRTMAKFFNLTPNAVRFAAKRYGVKVSTELEVRQRIRAETKKEPEPRENAAYQIQGIDHKGGRKVWIPAERLSVTISAGKDIQEAVDKIVFRHDKIKFD